jgi:hypothetical protein
MSSHDHWKTTNPDLEEPECGCEDAPDCTCIADAEEAAADMALEARGAEDR